MLPQADIYVILTSVITERNYAKSKSWKTFALGKLSVVLAAFTKMSAYICTYVNFT